VPKEKPTDCWKTPKTTYIMSIRSPSIPFTSASVYLRGLSEWCLTKYVHVYVSCFLQSLEICIFWCKQHKWLVRRLKSSLHCLGLIIAYKKYIMYWLTMMYCKSNIGYFISLFFQIMCITIVFCILIYLMSSTSRHFPELISFMGILLVLKFCQCL
jgi:hypothetical protein